MKEMNRRDFVKMTGAAAVGLALSPIPGMGKAFAQAPVVGSAYMPKTDGNGSCAKTSSPAPEICPLAKAVANADSSISPPLEQLIMIEP